MKKTAITLCAAMMCTIMSASAAPTPSMSIPSPSVASIVPVTCPASSPCATPCEQKKEPCCEKKKEPCPTCGKTDCNCNSTPVFNSCEEIQAWKTKYFEQRCEIYTNLGLTQEQRVKGKCIDEKFFDEIAPLKMCCKQEKAKLEKMKCQKCSWRSKHEQRQKIRDLKSEIKDKQKDHQKCFMQILNQCQKDKYKKLTKKDKCDC